MSWLHDNHHVGSPPEVWMRRDMETGKWVRITDPSEIQAARDEHARIGAEFDRRMRELDSWHEAGKLKLRLEFADSLARTTSWALWLMGIGAIIVVIAVVRGGS